VRSWEDLQREFRRVMHCRGAHTIDEITAVVPFGRTTVYRLISGELRNPRPAVRACVENLVSEAFLKEQSDVGDTKS